jgi:hypothetical protein
MSGVVRIEIRETTEDLKTLMRKEKDVWRHEKLQVLYWLKTKMVESVLSTPVRRTGNIVPQYKDGCLVILKGGIEELLLQKPRSGRPRIMNPETVERLSKELQEPEGFNSYKEVHQWLTSCCEVKVAYRTVHQWARYRLQGKLKVPRPVNEKQKPGVYHFSKVMQQ